MAEESSKLHDEMAAYFGLTTAELHEAMDRMMIETFGSTCRKTANGEPEDSFLQLAYDFPDLFRGEDPA